MFFLLGLSDLPLPLTLLCLIASVMLIVASLLGGGARAIIAPRRRSAAFMTILLLAFVLRARAGINANLAVGLDGAALVVVMFGLRGALLVLALANLVFMLLDSAAAGLVAVTHAQASSGIVSHWANFGVQYLLTAAVPAISASLMIAGIRRWLPPHLFIFIFGHGFFSAAIASACGLIVTAAALSVFGVASSRWLFGEVLPGALLLAWGNAFLAGGLTAIFVMFRPDWVLSFDDRIYLAKPPA